MSFLIKHIKNKMASIMGIQTAHDGRSKRFVAAIECILNQNARDMGAATYPAMNGKILQICMDYDVGILQIPCPEMAFLGLDRKRPQGQSLRAAMNTNSGHLCCQKLSVELADRVEDYVNNGYNFLAVLGGNVESPGCAVHYGNAGLAHNSGIFMQEFYKELQNRHIIIPFRGIRDINDKMLQEDMIWLKQLVDPITK